MGCAASSETGQVVDANQVTPARNRRPSGPAASPKHRPYDRIIVIDCDSTLTHIEGIDEVGRLRGPEVHAECERLTKCAMDATMSIEETVRRRIAMLRPSRDDCAAIGELYKQNAQPGAREVLRELRESGWHVVIVSGGFRQCILPFAESLGVKDHADVHAIDISFDAEGNYAGFDETYPGTREWGKQQVVNSYLEKFKAKRSAEGRPDLPITVVMVGDGKSDLEVRPPAKFFIAYAGVIARKHVVAEADAVAFNWDQVHRYVETKFPSH